MSTSKSKRPGIFVPDDLAFRELCACMWVKMFVQGMQVLHRVGDKESVVLPDEATKMPIASIRFENVDPRIRGADLCIGGPVVARLTREDLLSAGNALTGPFFADDLPLGRARYQLIRLEYDIAVDEKDIEKHVETLWKPSDDPEDLVPCYDSDDDTLTWRLRAVPYYNEFDVVTLQTPDVYIEHAPDAPVDKDCRVWTPIVVDGNRPRHPDLEAKYPLDDGPLPHPGTSVRRRFANKLIFFENMAALAVSTNWDE